MNAASERRLSLVHPDLASRGRIMIAACARRGVHLEVVQGLRTFAEQDALFNQPRDGRDNDGDGRIDEPDECVTRARGGQSNHNYGIAFDVCPFVNGKPDWKASDATWKIIGQEGVRAGLEWGGNWKNFVDRPHFELPTGLSVRQCLAIYLKSKIAGVWATADRLLAAKRAGQQT